MGYKVSDVVCQKVSVAEMISNSRKIKLSHLLSYACLKALRSHLVSQSVGLSVGWSVSQSVNQLVNK